MPTYGVLMRIVRSDAEPSATYFTPPTRIHSSPKPVVDAGGLEAGERGVAADQHVRAVAQLAVGARVLVGEDAVAIGAGVVHRRQARRGEQLRDVPHAVAAALALLLRRERLPLADPVEHVARVLGDAAGQLAVFVAEEAAVIGIGRAACVMPASSNALLLYKLVWPPRCATDDRMLRRHLIEMLPVSGTSSLVSSNMTAVTHWPGGVLSAFLSSAAASRARAGHWR